MKKLSLFSAFLMLSISVTNLQANQPTYFCKADQAAGFEMKGYSGWQAFSERDSSEFRVHFDDRLGLEAEIRTNSGGWTQWTPLEQGTYYWTDTGMLGFNQFVFATKTLRFYAAYSGGYLNGKDSTTWAVIGQCHQM